MTRAAREVLAAMRAGFALYLIEGYGVRLESRWPAESRRVSGRLVKGMIRDGLIRLQRQRPGYARRFSLTRPEVVS